MLQKRPTILRSLLIVVTPYMTNSYVCHVSFMHVSWLIHTCAMTHSYMCHDSFIHVPRLIYTCPMTHSCMCHDSLSLLPRLCPASVWHSSYSAWHNPFIRVTWLLTRMTHTSLSTPHSIIQDTQIRADPQTAGGLMRQCHIWDHGFLPLPLGTINMSSATIHTRMWDTRTQTSHMRRHTCANMLLCDGEPFTECSTAGGEVSTYFRPYIYLYKYVHVYTCIYIHK